jgi:hypothetical protein
MNEKWLKLFEKPVELWNDPDRELKKASFLLDKYWVVIWRNLVQILA